MTCKIVHPSFFSPVQTFLKDFEVHLQRSDYFEGQWRIASRKSINMMPGSVPRVTHGIWPRFTNFPQSSPTDPNNWARNAFGQDRSYSKAIRQGISSQERASKRRTAFPSYSHSPHSHPPRSFSHALSCSSYGKTGVRPKWARFFQQCRRWCWRKRDFSSANSEGNNLDGIPTSIKKWGYKE